MFGDILYSDFRPSKYSDITKLWAVLSVEYVNLSLRFMIHNGKILSPNSSIKDANRDFFIISINLLWTSYKYLCLFEQVYQYYSFSPKA